MGTEQFQDIAHLSSAEVARYQRCGCASSYPFHKMLGAAYWNKGLAAALGSIGRHDGTRFFALCCEKSPCLREGHFRRCNSLQILCKTTVKKDAAGISRSKLRITAPEHYFIVATQRVMLAYSQTIMKLHGWSFFIIRSFSCSKYHKTTTGAGRVRGLFTASCTWQFVSRFRNNGGR